jgi:glyoxylase-like metal-dependent hydrolase (beta-lactamase superfamily II)
MNEALSFDRSEISPSGGAVRLSPLIRRLVAPNGGPFTFTGTCTYVMGERSCVVIDPGPENETHLAALLTAIGSAEVSAILVTHTHKDHSPLASRLKALTGAPILGCAPHFSARALSAGEVNALDASADHAYAPDRVLLAGDVVAGDGFHLVTVPTPGHTMNHLAFALPEEQALFSGDHVMAWSTSIVAPPDGSMGAYMASLALLQGREDAIYYPGHGAPVLEPRRYVKALIGHRKMREATILEAVKAGERYIPEIVAKLYAGLDPKLHGAAALSVFAHLEELVARGLVRTEGEPTLDAAYWSRSN